MLLLSVFPAHKILGLFKHALDMFIKQHWTEQKASNYLCQVRGQLLGYDPRSTEGKERCLTDVCGLWTRSLVVISPCPHLLWLQMKLILVKEKNREDNLSLWIKWLGFSYLNVLFPMKAKMFG